ncbi:MAG: flotillin-like FloA family protein [Clostridia bacterium]|nr:flotillin-like FloA family protein [Clostridia bacterium]
MSVGAIVAIVLAGLVFLTFLIVFLLLPKKVYFSAMFSGVYVSLFKLIGMKMRKLDLEAIVGAYILAKKSHIGLGLYDFEIVATSGGHPKKIVEGLIAGKNAKLDIDFEFAKAIDIAGMDILAVVRECVNPKVIEIPLISSVAQDKREVNVKISLTLKTVLSNFLRGVTEDTISARAVEAVVTKISNTERASFLVAKPQLLDKAIFDAQIDSDSKYELVSADVIHIDLGNDRGLATEKEQIEKNRMISANQLEHRRLMALAVEQEMKAKAEEKKLEIIENEAEIPRAMAQAIKEGKIKDVVDYYKLQNLQADTEMRRAFMGKSSKTDMD